MDAAIRDYLHAILGITPKVGSWPGSTKLPYFFHDAFDIRQLRLHERQFLLAVDKHPHTASLATLGNQLDKLSQLTGVPAVYATTNLAAYERKRLIQHKVPFIVPGNQLYLPDLGIDLREYFRQRHIKPNTALSPATQAVLIAALLRQPWQEKWSPAEIVHDLGYTAMTLSRVTKELTAAGIGILQTEGKARWLRIERTARETWEHARPMMRSPVKRQFWARPQRNWKTPRVLHAGLDALARYSMLSEPKWPVFAISSVQWKAANDTGIEILPEHIDGACEWQLWHYNPALATASDIVDPLSLMLSLEGDADERVQQGLDELKDGLPW